MSGANCITENFSSFSFIPRLLSDSEAAHVSILKEYLLIPCSIFFIIQDACFVRI